MILLSTGSLHTYGLNRAFELAAEAGYDGLEIIIDQRADTWQAHYLLRLSREVGLPIRAVHSPFLLGIPGWPVKEGERILRTVELAETLGAKTIVVHLPTRWPYGILTTPRSRPWNGHAANRQRPAPAASQKRLVPPRREGPQPATR